jgi:hypothetical protein
MGPSAPDLKTIERRAVALWDKLGYPMNTQKPCGVLYHLGGTGAVVSAFPMG